MPKGVATPPEVVEKIKLCRAIGMSLTETAKFCGGIPDTTVFMVMKKILSNPETAKEFEELKAQKKKEFQDQANQEFNETIKESFENLFKRSVKVINKAIDEDKLSPHDAVVVMGTTFDKRQVLTGGKTANVGITYEEVLNAINKGDEF
jgi:serine/threonine protein phosphatase PrpC